MIETEDNSPLTLSSEFDLQSESEPGFGSLASGSTPAPDTFDLIGGRECRKQGPQVNRALIRQEDYLLKKLKEKDCNIG